MTAFHHITVLREEAVAALHPSDGEILVDLTLGGGGHAEVLLESANCRVIGLDRDPAAIAAATERLARFGERFTAVHARFSQISEVLDRLSLPKVHGIVADLGVSSPQLDDAARGFSFRQTGPVDMRMDPSSALSAAELVNTLDEVELGRILRDYGEEREWRRVTRAIIAGRPWTETTALANAIAAVVGKREQHRIHPATRSFQGLRIAVNDELGELERLLPIAVNRLYPGGRVAIITFHSLEDRIVKQFLAREAGRGVERDPYGYPVRAPLLSSPSSLLPSPQDPNPRARSARLRTAVRLP